MPTDPLKKDTDISLVVGCAPEHCGGPDCETCPPPDRAPLLQREKVHLRQWIQIAFLAVTLAIGVQFAIFVHQVGGGGIVSVQRPPGVEGFLPIGALMGWKLFASTGMWDPIHPAAMVILGFAALISFALRKSFCSWLCPVGTVSEWMWRWGKHVLGRNFQLPNWLDLPLRLIKYALLGFFVWVILNMDVRGIVGFLQSPYYKMSDVKMLHFFTRMTTLTGGVLAVLVIGSFFTRNFWCRYLCPYGALMGLLALAGPSHIRRNADTCVDCGRCSRACPYHLPVDSKPKIHSAECTACMDCVKICPVKGTLKFRTGGAKGYAWSRARLGIAVVLIFVSCVYAGRITGHWQSHVRVDEFRHHLKNIDAPEMTHP